MPPQTETHLPWICLAGALACYTLLLLVNPVRQSLRDGLHCLGRHGSIWAILALFGLFYAVFNVGVEVYMHYALPDGMRPVFQWSRPWFLPGRDWPAILKQSVLPALEGFAGVFNVLVTTFPFCAIAALLFFFNWGGHHAVLLRALRHRLGGLGLLAYAGVLVCAVAALVKPLLFTPLFLKLAYSMRDPLGLLQCASIIDWLSFLFEIMFGIGVQIYLILMVYAWVRGLNFTTGHLMDFAIRRFSFVMKWTAWGLLLSTLLIKLPLILLNFPAATDYFGQQNIIHFHQHVGRPVMAVFFILFSGMQVILTFHSESLVKALRDLGHFLLKEAWPVAGYLLIAFVHFYIITALDQAMRAGFGADNGPAIAWSLVYPLLDAFVGGWMLASWVCLYKRSETGRVRDEHWIKY